jgi:hypothetical protein
MVIALALGNRPVVPGLEPLWELHRVLLVEPQLPMQHLHADLHVLPLSQQRFSPTPLFDQTSLTPHRLQL